VGPILDPTKVGALCTRYELLSILSLVVANYKRFSLHQNFCVCSNLENLIGTQKYKSNNFSPFYKALFKCSLTKSKVPVDLQPKGKTKIAT